MIDVKEPDLMVVGKYLVNKENYAAALKMPEWMLKVECTIFNYIYRQDQEQFLKDFSDAVKKHGVGDCVRDEFLRSILSVAGGLIQIWLSEIVLHSDPSGGEHVLGLVALLVKTTKHKSPMAPDKCMALLQQLAGCINKTDDEEKKIRNLYKSLGYELIDVIQKQGAK
jgi:hypothetical protein